MFYNSIKGDENNFILNILKCEVEQELLKGVYERKKELLDTKRWEVTEKQSATQPSFICNNLFDGKITNDTWWEN